MHGGREIANSSGASVDCAPDAASPTTSEPAHRCAWVGDDPRYVLYHDREWGVPSRDDRHLFEMLVLEGAQAGLAWITILRKRESYREAFCGWDPAQVARLADHDVAWLLLNEGIVRHEGKVRAAIANAGATLAIQEEFGSLSGFLWDFVGGRPIQNAFERMSDLPAQTERSGAMSEALKARGFRFVGPTTCYAFMQAVGMVNDHEVSCFRYREVSDSLPDQRSEVT